MSKIDNLAGYNDKANINWYKPTYGKLLYEAINEKVVIKKLETDILTIFLRILNT